MFAYFLCIPQRMYDCGLFIWIFSFAKLRVSGILKTPMQNHCDDDGEEYILCEGTRGREREVGNNGCEFKDYISF